jgi:hypothetical protein
MLYKHTYIKQLTDEAHARFNRLMDALPLKIATADNVLIDSTKTRLAVSDFKAILAEVNRLK